MGVGVGPTMRWLLSEKRVFIREVCRWFYGLRSSKCLLVVDSVSKISEASIRIKARLNRLFWVVDPGCVLNVSVAATLKKWQIKRTGWLMVWKAQVSWCWKFFGVPSAHTAR